MHSASRPCSRSIALIALALSPRLIASAPAQALPAPPPIPVAPAPEPSVTLPAPLARVLREYEPAWQRKDAKALASLFAEDGFVLSGGTPPSAAALRSSVTTPAAAVRSRCARSPSRRRRDGYILGGYARHAATGDAGKFTLTLRRGPDARWLIVSDMDNGNGPPAASASAPYAITDVDTAHGDREFHLLWPDGAPGAVGSEAADKPKLTVYRAPAEDANGAAVVVCPGGGYGRLAADHEGKQVASGSTRSASRPSCSSTAWARATTTRPRSRTRSGRSALVRARASEWGVDPHASASSASPPAATSPRPRPRTSTTAARTPPTRSSGRARGPTSRCSPTRSITLEGPPRTRARGRNLLGEPADPALVELPEQRAAGDGPHAADLPVPHRRRPRRAGAELAALLRRAAGGGRAGRAPRLRARQARRRPRARRPRAVQLAAPLRALDEAAGGLRTRLALDNSDNPS